MDTLVTQPQPFTSLDDTIATGRARVNLFSSREIYQIAFRHICAEDSGFVLVQIANTLPENGSTLLDSKPDLVVIDMELLLDRWPEILEQLLNADCGATHILIIFHALDKTYLDTALSYGVKGYLLNSASASEVRQALHVVAAGGLWLGQSLTYLQARQQTGSVVSQNNHHMVRLLSQRELQVLNEVARGTTTREIARALILSESSVRTYWYRVLSKLNALNTAEAIARAGRLGLLEVVDEEDERVLLQTKTRRQTFPIA